MTLPQLYANVTLRSYNSIRYCAEDGRPEGCGMASPFVMGLNRLVLRNVAAYVQKLSLVGEWNEHDLEECSRNGRVPDSSMMLNTLVSLVIERSTALHEFCWELNTKMLPTVWQHLAHSQIKSLTVRFPTSRNPRPVTVVPPIPNLVSLKLLDVDPLCYVDDVSLLFAGSKKLRELRIVWSPRMREEKEPSINLHTMFARCRAPDQTLKLTTIAIKNLFTHGDGACADYYDPSCLEDLIVINCTGGFGDPGASAFVDNPFRKTSPPLPRLKSVRGDKPSKENVRLLTHIRGLEKLYIIGVKKTSPRNGFPPRELNADSLRDQHIEVITRNHGQTLRHLLLPCQWLLTFDHIQRIAQSCLNLEQLAFAATPYHFTSIAGFLRSLPMLTAIRLLEYPYANPLVEQIHEFEDFHAKRCVDMMVDEGGQTHMPRWIEIGDQLFEISQVIEQQEDSEMVHPRRRIRERDRESVEDIDIWNLDSLEI
ncbi:MAG: hypothetical protein LQ338_007361 [Usnochroma carphineum]|nr:MAG: hypothetical protein LQ338_007361 [Usnochroma carphineum]